MDKRTTIDVHLQPGAKRDEIIGFRGDVLRAKVTAVAEKGRANQALLELVADAFGVPKSAIAIVRGQTSRNKVVSIQGLTREDLKAILERDISCKELFRSLKK
ncbi:MAG TPA: DUF167 domain-containing protein [Dehalococcoidia bacterium]|nr:DUF167 domain-containing protein [Dehalococcoidia bacterium]